MRRFLLCGCVDGRPKSLEFVRHAVETRRPEGILFAGGVLDRVHRHNGGGAATALRREDAVFVEHFLETVGGLGIFSAIIPGPADYPLEDFLRMSMHAEVEFPGLHVVHGSLLEKGNLAVVGMGGCLRIGSPGCCSRTLMEYQLRALRAAKQPRRILLLAAPPPGPLGGEEGNPFVGELIDSHHPSLCVVAGPGERRGIERVASTLVVNPGRLGEGWAAWLDWDRPAEEQVELLNLRQLQRVGVLADTGVCD
jgi:Icc-related predicted phosphoesterase